MEGALDMVTDCAHTGYRHMYMFTVHLGGNMVKRPKPDKLVAYVRPDLKRELEKLAARRGLSVSTLVNLALTAYVKKEGQS